MQSLLTTQRSATGSGLGLSPTEIETCRNIERMNKTIDGIEDLILKQLQPNSFQESLDQLYLSFQRVFQSFRRMLRGKRTPDHKIEVMEIMDLRGMWRRFLTEQDMEELLLPNSERGH